MKKYNLKHFVPMVSALVALVAVHSAYAITAPIQTQHGVVRLGTKTQANVDSNDSQVTLGKGMILASSNPGGLGRGAVKVDFGGAPMVAKVHGTALIAYLPGGFVEITGVEGRTYLSREGKLGENVAIDAGKMLLVKPTANRLPDTVDVNLKDLVKNSPLLNDGLNLATSPLIARAIDKQSRNRYLKPTPIHFDGAGTVAIVQGGNGKVPSSAGTQSQPLDTSLVAVEAIEQLPRQFAPPQIVATVASYTGGGPAQQPPGPPSPPSPPYTPPGPPSPPNPPPVVDLPGAPLPGTVITNAASLGPTQGIFEEFDVLVDGKITPGNGTLGTTVWFPADYPDALQVTYDRLNQEFAPGMNGHANTIKDITLEPLLAGLTQGAEAGANAETALVFKQITVTNADPTFTINPTQGPVQIEFRLSTDAIPSDLLTRNEFLQAFTYKDPSNVTGVYAGYTLTAPGTGDFQLSSSGPINNPDSQLGMDIEVPQQGLKYTWNALLNQAPTNPTNSPNDVNAGPGQLVGLTQSTILGSAYINVLSPNGVTVQAANATTALLFQSTDKYPGVFSVQAPPLTGPPPTGPSLIIESDGPLHISDPMFDPNTGTSPLTSVELDSKQDVAVQSGMPTPIAVNSATQGGVTAGQSIVLPVTPQQGGKLTVGLDYWIGTYGRVNLRSLNNGTATFFAYSSINSIPSGTAIYDTNPAFHGQVVLTQSTVNAGQGIALTNTNNGQIRVTQSTLNAGQGINLTGANQIVIEDSSQLQALTDIVMQGSSTATLNITGSTIKSATGQILLDQFSAITIESSQLMASVLKARVISPNGVLMISNSTLNAGSLLRLYAEGSNGTVEFVGNVTLKGNTIDIAGNTVQVDANGHVTTGQNTTVYANTHNYNKQNYGTISNSPQQKSFGARPGF